MGTSPTVNIPTKADLDEVARQTHQDMYKRQVATSGRVRALDELHAKLVDDARLYQSEDLQDQRDAIAHALLAVTNFLESQGFSTATVIPLLRPVSALVEREKNSLDPVFCERPRRGRPKVTLAQHERSGILASLANAWLRMHVDDDRVQSEKLAEAARAFRGKWFGTVTRAQLETARELVSQESSDHPAVTSSAICDRGLMQLAAKFGDAHAITITIHMFNNTGLRSWP